MININRTKKEHYVPRFYLKKFASIESGISKKNNQQKFLVYDKVNKKSYLSSIYDCACENYFYDLDNPKNIDFKKIIEEKLCSIEGDFSILLNKLINRCNQEFNFYSALITNRSERDEFSYYLAIQLLRTKKFRDIQEDFYQPIFKNRLRCYKAYKENCLKQKCRLDIDEININSKKYHLKTLLDNETLDMIVYFISNSYWTFEYNNTSIPFIISDNPVCRIPYLIDINSKLKLSPFIGPWFQIYFPLSPKIVLHIYREESILFRKLGKKVNNRLIRINKVNLIDNINQYQSIMANQKVFINPSNSELLEKYCSNDKTMQLNRLF